MCLRKQSYALNSQLSLLRLLFFCPFWYFKVQKWTKQGFLVFSNLKNGCSFCFHFWAFSMVFLPDFPGSYVTQYNRAANFTARTIKYFPKLQKKFSGVPAKISRCSMKSFGLCHEIIWPVILKSFGLSQDLPLSQNGQNRRRKEKQQRRMD